MSFLDTSFIIDLLREEKRRTRGPAHQKLEQLGFTPVRLSLFVVCELEAGASLSASKKEREQINDKGCVKETADGNPSLECRLAGGF